MTEIHFPEREPRDNRAVFLDRDGVLVRSKVVNGKPLAPRCLDDFEILPDAPAAVKSLKEARYRLIVVTNQPDVGNGIVDRAVVETMHERLRSELPIDAIWVCYHSQSAGCSCRKPAPGMLIEAAAEYGLDLPRSFIVGDRWSDVIAGRAAGCYTVFVDRAYDESVRVEPNIRVQSVSEAALSILAHAETLGET